MVKVQYTIGHLMAGLHQSRLFASSQHACRQVQQSIPTIGVSLTLPSLTIRCAEKCLGSHALQRLCATFQPGCPTRLACCHVTLTHACDTAFMARRSLHPPLPHNAASCLSVHVSDEHPSTPRCKGCNHPCMQTYRGAGMGMRTGSAKRPRRRSMNGVA